MSQRSELIRKCGLIGAGLGLALFGVFGLLQGALLGGAAGLGIANHVFGANTFEIMADDLLPRIIVAASMLAGVIVSLIMFVVAGTLAGAAAGFALSRLVPKGRTTENLYEVEESEYAVQAVNGKD